jgi:hypothetical protein
MKEQQENQPRGLVAIHESKQRRLHGRLPAIPTRFWLWTLTVLVAWGIFYWKRTTDEVESQKSVLLAKQRGVLNELGPKYQPLQTKIEEWTKSSAGPYEGDLVVPDLKTWDFAGAPGIYLRIRHKDATTAESIRKAASSSLRDAFTACLFHEPNADPWSGPPCQASHDCSPKETGTFCNEVDHCMKPAQPFNMRMAYHGARILSDEWTVRLRTASDDMRMRLLEREYDSAVKDDIPAVIDLLQRAQFFLLVLDEESTEALPKDKPPLEAIQALPHPARVFLFGLKPGMEKPLLRLRRDVAGRFIPAGEVAQTDPALIEAQQRQVNSCQLALFVREAVGR